MSSETAIKLLNSLIDRIEKKPETERSRDITSKLQIDRFTSPHQRLAYEAVLQSAEKTGAVQLERGKGEIAHLFIRIRLLNSQALYSFLNRTPAIELANKAADKLLTIRNLSAATDVCISMAKSWRENETFLGFSWRDDFAQVKNYLYALDAVLQHGFLGQDMRTISRRRTGDSKLIENHITRIARWFRETGQASIEQSDREVLAAIGLEKIAQPVFLAGPIKCNNIDLSSFIFIGVSHEDVTSLIAQDHILITIENFTSFNRYIREARQQNEVILYTAGFPSLTVAKAIETLARDATKVYHWGDLDFAGAHIGKTIEQHARKSVTPWMMPPDYSPESQLENLKNIKINWDNLIEYFQNKNTQTIEQEEFDPQSPSSATDHSQNDHHPTGDRDTS